MADTGGGEHGDQCYTITGYRFIWNPLLFFLEWCSHRHHIAIDETPKRLLCGRQARTWAQANGYAYRFRQLLELIVCLTSNTFMHTAPYGPLPTTSPANITYMHIYSVNSGILKSPNNLTPSMRLTTQKTTWQKCELHCRWNYLFTPATCTVDFLLQPSPVH